MENPGLASVQDAEDQCEQQDGVQCEKGCFFMAFRFGGGGLFSRALGFSNGKNGPGLCGRSQTAQAPKYSLRYFLKFSSVSFIGTYDLPPAALRCPPPVEIAPGEHVDVDLASRTERDADAVLGLYEHGRHPDAPDREPDS